MQVSQDITLFDDTIENNIKYAKPDASDEEIEQACRMASAEDSFLTRKYKTLIGENGVRLSGGQKNKDYL